MQETHDREPFSPDTGPAVALQSWRDLAFFHWQVPAERLREHLPSGLDLDTFEGRAYLTVVPMTVVDSRPRYVPHLLSMRPYHELNVRTYVRRGEERGTWFLRMQVSSRVPALLARLGRLPFRYVPMKRSVHEGIHELQSDPTGGGGLQLGWREGPSVGAPLPGSIEEFLTQRYYTYSRAVGGRLLRWRLRHPPWPLRRGESVRASGGLLDQLGVPVDLSREPVVYHVDFMAAELLAPTLVGAAEGRAALFGGRTRATV